jgi:hypothetical protein
MVERDAKPIEYRRRIVDDDLDALMPGLAAISIEGPKAVGKTATALTRASTVYKLDDVGQRQIIDRPGSAHAGPLPILVDEWQKWPPSWMSSGGPSMRIRLPGASCLPRIGAQLLDAVLVTTGTEAYRRDDGIAVVPAALLGP